MCEGYGGGGGKPIPTIGEAYQREVQLQELFNKKNFRSKKVEKECSKRKE
jgi:hypothetical protein